MKKLDKLLKPVDVLMEDILPKKISKQVPNALTVSRLLGTVALSASVLTMGIGSGILLGLCTTGIIATDFLDGFIARRYNIQSKFGTVVDTIADKTLFYGLGLALLSIGAIPLWILPVPLIRDVVVNVECARYFKRNNEKEDIKNKSVNELDYIPPTIFAKLKTATLFTGLATTILSASIPILSLVSLPLLASATPLSFLDILSVNKKIVDNENKKNLEQELQRIHLLEEERKNLEKERINSLQHSINKVDLQEKTNIINFPISEEKNRKSYKFTRKRVKK